MSFYLSLSPPYRWARTDKAGRVIESGMADDLYGVPVPPSKQPVIGVAPGEDVVVHKVTVPGRNRAKAIAAIPYVLEESLAEDVDKLHFALLDWAPGREALVAVVAKIKMQAWLDAVAALGRDLDTIIPDYLVLPLHPQASVSVAEKEPGMLVIRSGAMEGQVLDETALAIWWREINDPEKPIAVVNSELAHELLALGATRVSEWGIGANYVDWLRNGATIGKINLLQGDFAPARAQQAKGSLWPAAIILILAALVKVGGDATEYFVLARENNKLEQQIVSVFRETFPDMKRIVNPRVQMERRAAQITSGAAGQGDFTYLLGVAATVLKQNNVNLSDLTFRDGSLHVTCTLKQFSDLDKVKRAFEAQQDVNTDLESSNAQGNQVSARFKLSRGKP